jgi:hypothetical protein
MTDRPSALVPVADDVWAIEDRVRQPGGVILPLRATVVRLPGGEILVHAPTPLRPGLIEEVTELGPVRHLVAPSRLHHLSMGSWSVRFPEARLWGAHGLRQKRRDLVFTGELGGGEADASGDRAAAPPPFADTLQPLLLAGAPALSEVVFFHRPSRSLLCADLLFNVRRPETFSTRLVLSLMGTNGRLAMSRVWRFYTKDRLALRASLEHMLEWDFARLVPAHGEIHPAESEGGAARAVDARADIRAALAWALR